MVAASDGGPPADAVLALRGVWKIYPATTALRDISLSAFSGRTLALLGPNGAGKSTVLRIASGLVRPTRGTVKVAGENPGHDGVRRLIGFAGHRTFLYAALSAEENLRFYADLYGLSPSAVDAALKTFMLEPVRRRPVRELSRGLTQRLNLARALLHDPRIILLDEPFTGLDAAITASVVSLLVRLRGEGRTVVLATHEWERTRALADDAVVLVGGRIIVRRPAPEVAPSDLPALYAQGAPA